MMTAALAFAVALSGSPTVVSQPQDTVPVVPLASPVTAVTRPKPAASAAAPKAIDYSDAYYTRLTIHRIGSYTMLPLFGAEYLLGQKLLSGAGEDSWVKGTHVGVAMGLGGLFTVNTVTGLWNLWESRNDPADRTRRYLHTVLMLAADAGFALAPAFADDDGGGNATMHKNIAIGSMGLATLGTAIMWLRKD